MSLHDAVQEIDDERARAQLRGDDHAAARLGVLVDLVDVEAQYADGITVGLPIVRRRSDAPRGAGVRWWWDHDAVTRAARRVLGLRVPAARQECAA